MDGSEGVGPVWDIPIGLHCSRFRVESPWGVVPSSCAPYATSGGGSRISRQGGETHG